MVGRRIRGFGPYVNMRFKTDHFSNGWLISGPPGKPVHVIAEGKVLYASAFRGYGTLIIVEHSPRFHSLYGHLGTLHVAVNDVVSQDEVIGLSRNARERNSGQVYFEIRKDKVAFDPKLVLNEPR